MTTKEIKCKDCMYFYDEFKDADYCLAKDESISGDDKACNDDFEVAE